MAAQKRPAPPSDHRRASDGSPPPLPPQPAQHQLPQQREGEQQPPANQLPELPQEQDDSEGEEGGSPSSPSTADKDEFILVKLADIRKEVQCPICLGIIRKTRTVMECLHRFCRECIDKSMRLGNNECPACRTHCASRRSLRDDPNYDALISLLYPDIDVYEEEELAFHEEEKTRNRKIQACIAETFRRQSEALGRRRSKATAADFVRKSHGNLRSGYQRGRGRTAGREGSRDTSLAGSDEEEDANANGSSKDSSSAEERSPDVRQKRCRRWAAPRSSPGRTSGDANAGYNENDELELSRENFRTSPLRSRKREMLAWGKAGARSQTRHGSSSGLNGRFFKGGRVTKLVECLRNLDENDDEFDLHLTLLPVDERSVPNLQRPYLCCRPTLSIRHLCQFIALQTSARAEEIEMFAWKPPGGTLSTNSTYPMGKAEYDPSEELTILGAQESLAGLRASLSSTQGDLVLLYRLKTQS